MKNQVITGQLYETLTKQIFELGNQLTQHKGYPYNPYQLKASLKNIIDGRFWMEIYGLKLGGETTTDDIVKVWHGAGLYVSEYITQKNFPLAQHQIEDVEIEIIDPGCAFTESEGLKFLEAAGLKRPEYEHGLRFAEQYGILTTSSKPNVIFLHKPWMGLCKSCSVLSVGRDPGPHTLRLEHVDLGFGEQCLLAGVRPHK